MKKSLIKLPLLLLVTNSNVFASEEGKENTVLKILNLKHNDGVTLKTVGSFLGESADQLKSVVCKHIQSYPKAACVLGVAGLATGGYCLYKKFANTLDQEMLKSMFDDIDTSSLLLITGAPQENCSQSNVEQIDPELKSRIDQEITARDGDVNAFVENWDGIDRTVLMNYIFDNNFEAIEYLINEKKASLNLVNSRRETIYNYAATMASPEVLEYLLSFELPQNVNIKSVIEDLEFTIYHATPSDKIKYNSILERLQALEK
jgi:hypothetical protein